MDAHPLDLPIRLGGSILPQAPAINPFRRQNPGREPLNLHFILTMTLTDFLLILLFGAALFYWLGGRFFLQHPPVYKGRELDFGPDSALTVEDSPWLRLTQADHPGDAPAFVVFDTETVAMAPRTDLPADEDMPPAVSLSWSLLNDKGHLLHTHTYTLLSDYPISPQAVAYHGVTERIRSISGTPAREVYARFIADTLAVPAWAAHSAPFHRSVVCADLARYGFDPTPYRTKPLYCTMLSGSRYLLSRGEWGGGGHISLVSLFGLLYLGRVHGNLSARSKSLLDVTLCALCFTFLLQRNALLLLPEFAPTPALQLPADPLCPPCTPGQNPSESPADEAPWRIIPF